MSVYDLTQTLPTKINVGDVLNCPYSGVAVALTLPPGRYELECWGAQGGYRSNVTYGGKGGYASGVLSVQEETGLHLYAGGSGNTGGNSGGFNGGGRRASYNGGGGASDIRLRADNLLARVIVAGGGGSDGASNKKGMYGGGESGGSATQSYGSGGYGGTQTGISSSSWQTSAPSTGTSSQSDAYAGFGFGGNGVSRSSGHGGAGGGGWYGGAGAYPDGSGDDDRGGGGGSGWVWTGENEPNGFLLTTADQLTNAALIGGNQSITSPSGSPETGHSGDGYIRITVLELYATAPDTPGNLRQTVQDYFSIGIAWDAVECDGYKVYRDGSLISTQTGISILDTGVAPYNTYTYTVVAYNDEGDSDPAQLVAQTTQGYAAMLPVVTGASIAPNPAGINTPAKIQVFCVDTLVILDPAWYQAGEIQCGEG